jgi:hypothetical protein
MAVTTLKMVEFQQSSYTNDLLGGGKNLALRTKEQRKPETMKQLRIVMQESTNSM